MEEGQPIKAKIQPRQIGFTTVTLYEHVSEVLVAASRQEAHTGCIFVAGRDAEQIVGRAVMLTLGLAQDTSPNSFSFNSIDEAVEQFLANEQADRLRNFMTK